MAPQWSPDGTKIAYGDYRRHGTFVIDVATGVTTEVLGPVYRADWADAHTWIIVGF